MTKPQTVETNTTDAEPTRATPREPNYRALEVMKRIAEIHATMNPRPGKSSVELIREIRSGGHDD